MKREFLEGLGLEKETADKIMMENGADLEREKAKTAAAKADLADAREKLAQRDKDLEDLKRSSGDAEAVRKQLEELQTKYTTETEQYKAQLEERDYADAIGRAIFGKGLKFTSKSAERAFTAALKEKRLELKDGKLTGLDEFIQEQKETDPDAFAPEKPAPRFATGSGSGSGHGEPPKPISRAAKLAAEHHNSLYGEVKKE